MSRKAGTGAVRFGPEKRWILGLLALVAPLPLPFNNVLGWGWYLLYALLLLPYLRRARRGAERWLPLWAANLLAVAYLPVLLLDLTALSGGRVVGPVLRLGLFAVTVKLWSLRLERDKWHAAIGIFFLFLAATATSVHLSVVLYLTVFLGGSLLLLARFALLHLLAGFGHRDAAAVPVPLAGFTAVAVAAAVVLAVPLFAFLPRVQSPYISSVAGGGGGEEIGVSGFSDRVTLDSIARVRTSRAVALRLSWAEGEAPEELRLKGGSFDLFDGAAWRRSDRWRQIRKEARTVVDLPAGAAGPAVGEVEIWLQPLGATGLPLPVESLSLDVPRRGLELSSGGSVRLPVRPRQPLTYRVSVARGPVLWAPPPADRAAGPAPADAPTPTTLDTTGLSPAMERLAARVAGDGGAAEKAAAVERWFGEEFTYTLDFAGRPAERRLEDFLLTHRSGHCEYFASAMVLLLRSQGVHARLVTGFLGGERTPMGYTVVRQGNAHAWVEAWVPGEGWRIYDPTPPAGRPGVTERTLLALAGQLYDNLVFQWDRYVLSYGVEDQMDVLYAFVRRAWALLDGLRGGGGEQAAVDGVAPPAAEPSGPASTDGGAGEPGRWGLTAVLSVLALLLVLRLWRLHRRPLSATAAYRLLRRRLESAGVALPPSTAPLALERQAAHRFPAAADGTQRVVRSYLRESFGGEELAEGEREGLRRALDAVRRNLRQRELDDRRRTA